MVKCHFYKLYFILFQNVQVTEFPSCPICLYPPVAAKMTRCGHIYCWACVLHYLALTDKPSQSTCPICYEVIKEQDLKRYFRINLEYLKFFFVFLVLSQFPIPHLI